jgi:manganese transport protein
LVTILPSLVVILIGLDPTRTLVISQVVLSFGLPFAVVPLIYFTSQRRLMRVLVNSKLTTFIAILVALLIIILNIFLLVQLFSGK